MTQAIDAPEIRNSRFWLYAPVILLALVAGAWSVGWFLVRDRAVARLDAWLAAEVGAGRQWTCRDRTIGGYPFRLEIVCASLDLQRGPVTATLGRVEAVAQVYQPRHVITEIEGPLHLTDGRVAVEGTWQLLETSLRGSANGLERASLVAEAPRVRITGAAATELNLSSQHLESHLRPSPGRGAEGAYDVAISALQADLPGLDALIGGSEPANIQVDLTATQAQGFRGRPVLDEVERWRGAGGKLDILLLSLAKGTHRMEAKGELRLDDLHRPAGTLDVSATGLDGVIGNLLGGRAGGTLLGSLLGQGSGGQIPSGNRSALAPLPPLRLDQGHLLIGPFVVPKVRLPALY
jgi:hypothetical protein